MTQVRTRVRDLVDFFFRRIFPPFPFFLRKPLLRLLNRAPFVSSGNKELWTVAGLRDLADRDNDEFNRFLWSNHLGPAAGFDASWRFEPGAEPSRRAFFTELERQLHALGVDPSHDVGSVLEVGSSLGINLRHLEQGLFSSADTLEGIDIDTDAVRQGSEYLSKLRSRVRLREGDMGRLDDVLQDQRFDIVICTGVLMYATASTAEQVINAMIRHSRHLLAISEPWDPSGPHVREDGAHFHDIEALVREAGGRVVGVQHRPDIHYGVSHQFVFAQRA
ncbi:MAG TPA: class I SAM-dependent methyltransferase [Candidatus Dormibacteraeota bacterium]|nr:class I SAM-dependent methyltransferase [Candidatus Dormibacteraeota bacterium]